MSGHRFAIRHQDTRQPVASHCVEHAHTMDDLSVMVLQKTASDSERFVSEKRWISQLVSDHPFGLNLEHVLAKNKHLALPTSGSARGGRPNSTST